MKLIFENWRKFLDEGGNVFDGKTASIPLEYIKPTLDKYREELNKLFPLKKDVFAEFRYLGSVGKKPISGDIDLAMDATSFFKDGVVTPEGLKEWNIDPDAWQSTFDLFKRRARTRTDAEIGWRAFLTELAKYFNNESDMIISDIKKIGPGTMFSLFPQFNEEGEQQDIGIQIDWMVGNADWLEFAYHSDPPSADDQFLKGLHRTQLMLAMFLIKDYTYEHISGIRKRGTRELVASSPEETLELLGSLYGAELTRETTNNYPALHKWLRTNASPEEYENVIGAYLKILDYTKSVKIGEDHCGYIPKDLEDAWIQKQEQYGLKGKYICKDINQKIWNHLNETPT